LGPSDDQEVDIPGRKVGMGPRRRTIFAPPRPLVGAKRCGNRKEEVKLVGAEYCCSFASRNPPKQQYENIRSLASTPFTEKISLEVERKYTRTDIMWRARKVEDQLSTVLRGGLIMVSSMSKSA
jgi:hypothetical protein